jgi:hypothetical protein
MRTLLLAHACVAAVKDAPAHEVVPPSHPLRPPAAHAQRCMARRHASLGESEGSPSGACVCDSPHCTQQSFAGTEEELGHCSAPPRGGPHCGSACSGCERMHAEQTLKRMQFARHLCSPHLFTPCGPRPPSFMLCPTNRSARRLQPNGRAVKAGPSAASWYTGILARVDVHARPLLTWTQRRHAACAMH